MIYYSDYADVPANEVDAFVRACELGRLVTVSADGLPHIGLYPFVYDGQVVEMHVHRADEQLADLKTRATCLFEVDEILATIPSYWVHPEDAVMATAYHRTVIFECTASVSDDPLVIAQQQSRLLARYQPEGGFREVTADHPLYGVAIAHIAAIRLEIKGRRVKFKLGQNRSHLIRANIIGELRQRGRRNDDRAAEALQGTIEREQQRRVAGEQR